MQNVSPVNSLITLLTPLKVEARPFSDDLPAGTDENYALFLRSCNGGYTDDRFLHLFGGTGPSGHNVFDWNRPEMWKGHYGLDHKFFCFAEDIFGNQYGFDLAKVNTAAVDFDAVEGEEGNVKILFVDTGELIPCAQSFEAFIEYYVIDHDTDNELRELYEAFVIDRGEPIPGLHHLSYKLPLLLGGDGSSVGNLEIVDSTTNLRFLGQVVSQVKKLPKGTKIKRVEIDREKAQITLLT
jgi:hypothetical protein